MAFGGLLVACSGSPYPGYTEIEKDIFIKRHNIGEGDRKAEKGDLVKARLIYQDLADSTWYDFEPDSAINDQDIVLSKVKKGDLRQALTHLTEGDSATFILDRKGSFIENYLPEAKDTLKTVKLTVVVREILDSKAQYTRREKDSWKYDEEMNEQIALKAYLEENGIGDEYYLEGAYYMEKKKGKGPRLKRGDRVLAHYKAYSLDSMEVYDNTYVSGNPLDFRLGDPDQTLKGFDICIRQMRPGGEARFIVPSQLAYGEWGSSTGIVPAYSSLIFEVKIVKVL